MLVQSIKILLSGQASEGIKCYDYFSLLGWRLDRSHVSKKIPLTYQPRAFHHPPVPPIL